MVGGADGVLVVFDNDHRIPEIPQAAEGRNEAVVVALVQTDARLVEDIQDTREARADLRGEPDALGLAAGECAALAVELHVAEPDLA